MLHKALRNLIDDALNAQPYRAHTPTGMHEPTAMVPQSTVRGIPACLKTQNLPALFDKQGELIRVPNAALAATTISLEAGLIAASRVAKAGAHVIVYPEASRAIATGRGGDVIFESKPGTFRTLEAAIFATVADDADAPLGVLPVSVADINWTQGIGKGFRIELPRKLRQELGADLICAEIVASLTLGLARAADEVLLSKIAAGTPTAFTVAKAAAQGLKFVELRGLVGTAGNGAVIGEDGALRAAGIASELTPDAASTIVGAWNRAAIAIHQNIDVHFERTNRNGDLVVTAWAHLLPLLPDTSKFWSVAA